MGLFNYFNRRQKNKAQNPAVEPAGQHGFHLKPADFSTTTHKAMVLDVKISAEFEKEFAHLITGKPAKAGEIIELETSKATVKIWGQAAEVTFTSGNISENPEAFTGKINQQLNWVNEHKNLFDETIIHDLLKLKNSNWLEENQAAITGVDLLNAVRLTSVNFLPDTGFELHFDDGNMFWGHTILVYVSAKREIKDAVIAG
jgi:hypothetical protein